MTDDAAIKNARILVVDDMPANVALLAGMLEQSGYTAVDALTDPQAALATLERCEHDLLLLDIRMPGIDGHEVMRRLAETP